MRPLRVTRKPLDPEFQKTEVLRISQLISSTVHPLAIYSFGSAAENKATDQSDFDFLIVVEDSENLTKARIKLRKLMPLSQFPVDLIWKKRTEFLTQREIGGIAWVVWEDGNCTFHTNSKEFINDKKTKI